jgi:hypothetical protein
MKRTAPMLRELQRAVRRSLVERDDSEASTYVAANGLSAAGRLAVYRNTFSSVLTNALRLSYPAVHRLVGAEFFEGAARVFIEAQPPHSACLDDYGGEFAEFLSRFPPAASLAYLPDVARLEWAINRALHAPDAKLLELARLAKVDEADQARVRFKPHPSVHLVSAVYPADAIWRGVLKQDDAALTAIDLSAGPVRLLVERRATGIEVRRLNDAEWRFTALLCAGRPLADAIEEAPDLEAYSLLAEHLAAGRFIGFDTAGASVTRLSKGLR